MFRRYWLPIIATVGLALPVQVQAQSIRHAARDKGGAFQGQQEPKADSPPTIPVAVQNDIHGIARALEAANQKQQSDADKDQAKRNLAAQEKMAAWVPWMFSVGLGETILTLTGVVLVWRTLKASWAAAQEARRAADAAHAAVAEARSSSESQLRAYVAISRRTVTLTSPGVVEVLVAVKNFGQTPARNLNFDWRAFVDDFPDGKNTYVPKLANENRFSLAPSDEYVLRWILRVKDDVAIAIVKRQQAIVGKGLVVYTDTFGVVRNTPFDVYLSGRRIKETPERMNVRGDGNHCD